MQRTQWVNGHLIISAFVFACPYSVDPEAVRLSNADQSHLTTMASEHEHSHEHQMENALQVLRDHGHRITEPRKAMLIVLTAEHGPFSAEDLHKKIGDNGCDVVTVYRSLAAMEEIGVVRRCDFGDGVYRYEFNSGEHHHHHIVCRSCRDVQTIDLCVADSLERIARNMGYAKVTHILEVFGVCPNCQQKEKT